MDAADQAVQLAEQQHRRRAGGQSVQCFRKLRAVHGVDAARHALVDVPRDDLQATGGGGGQDRGPLCVEAGAVLRLLFGRDP